MKKKSTFQKRQSRPIGALVVFFGICFFIYALLFPLYRIIDYVLSFAIIGLATLLFYWFITGKFAAKPKAATVSPPSQPAQSANPVLDDFTNDAKVLLTDLSLESSRIQDLVISEKTNELLVLCEHIFSTITSKPEKLPQIRKFMNYYLPTTANLLHKHRSLLSQQKDPLVVSQSRQHVLQALDLIVPACEKQLRALYQNEMLDMQTDVEVIEKMLKRDGLIKSDFSITP